MVARARRRPGAPVGPHRALLLTGPMAIVGVIAGVFGGSMLVSHSRAASADPAVVVGRAGGGQARSGAPIAVRVRLSSSLQAQIGQQAMDVLLPAGADVGTLLNRLGADYPVLAAMGPSIMVAVSGSMATPDLPLIDSETVELMSPFAGG